MFGLHATGPKPAGREHERERAALPALVERGLVLFDDRGHRAEAVHAAHVVGTVHAGTLCGDLTTTLNRRSARGGELGSITPSPPGWEDRASRTHLGARIAPLGRRVIGGGHNGLTCAAYLARAGKFVLVLEQRDRLGGACTLERPFPDQGYVVSPCAYVVGLLDRSSSTSSTSSDMASRCTSPSRTYGRRFRRGARSPIGSTTRRPRPVSKRCGSRSTTSMATGPTSMSSTRCGSSCAVRGRDSWIGESPTRDELEDMLGHDDWMHRHPVPGVDLRGARRLHR